MQATVRMDAPGVRLEPLEARRLLSAGSLVDTTQTINLGYFYSRAHAVALDGAGNLWVAGDADTELYSQTILTARFDPALGYQHARHTALGNFTAATALTVQDDDKAVVAGYRADVQGAPRDLVLARFNGDGTPDAEFGIRGDGAVVLDLGRDEAAHDLVIQTDGKIVVVGHDDARMLVARYLSDGRLDDTFGIGGLVAIDFGTDADSQADTVALGPGGTIVVGGYAADPDSGDARFALARLTDTGILDATFGGDGTIADAVAPGAFVHGLVVRADGSIVVLGDSRPDGKLNNDLTLAYYNAAGARQWLTFTDVGADTQETAAALGAASDGTLWVAGSTTTGGQAENILLARFSDSGVLDDTFHPEGAIPGILTIDVDGQDDAAHAIALDDTDGTLLLAGTAEDVNGTDQRLALFRIDPDAPDDGGGISPSSGANHVGIYRAGQVVLDSDGVRGASGGDVGFTFGQAGDVPLTGDWNGDGVTDVGVFRDGLWILDSNGTPGLQDDDLVFGFGLAGWTPIVGDWNGDGIDDVGVYTGAQWALDSDGNHAWSPGVDEVLTFGHPSFVPVVGDWNADGKTDIGVWADGRWGLDSDGVRGWNPGSDASFAFGSAGMTPVIGDWNGDGKSDVGVFSGGTWGLDSDGVLGWSGGDAVFAFGIAGWTPIVGDWNGDGKSDVAIFTGTKWGVDLDGIRGWTAGDSSFAFGQTGDVPLVGRW